MLYLFQTSILPFAFSFICNHIIIAYSSQRISNDPLCGRSYKLIVILAAIFAGDAQGKRKEIIVETTIGVEKASLFCSGVSFTGWTFPPTFVWKRRGLSRELSVAHARFGVDVRRKFSRSDR